MKQQLDMDKIARGLGAKRLGPIQAGGGYFGAMQLMAEIQGQFKVPSGGGRATDPKWTERRQVPFSPGTLAKLKALVQRLQKNMTAPIEPMQLAALLLEKELGDINVREAESLVQKAELSPVAASRTHRQAGRYPRFRKA